MRISDWSSDVCSSDLSSCSSMPDSPPQAIHGLLSACPGRDAAQAIRCHRFCIGTEDQELKGAWARLEVEPTVINVAGGVAQRPSSNTHSRFDVSVVYTGDPVDEHARSEAFDLARTTGREVG